MAADVIGNRESDRGVRHWLEAAFERALGREPNQSELESITRAFDESHEFYRADLEQAKALLGVSDAIAIPENGGRLAKLAALASVCQVIMNTDEFLTRE